MRKFLATTATALVAALLIATPLPVYADGIMDGMQTTVSMGNSHTLAIDQNGTLWGCA